MLVKNISLNRITTLCCVLQCAFSMYFLKWYCAIGNIGASETDKIDFYC